MPASVAFDADSDIDSGQLLNIETLPADRVYTYRYRQPSEYHFCLDSILFAGFVVSELRRSDRFSSGTATKVAAGLADDTTKDQTSDFRALDVCAGCGVIGFEISHTLPTLKNFDFMEIQEAFKESFIANLEQASLLSPRAFRFLNQDFRDLNLPTAKEQYDLIVANPPYFFEGEGLLSPSVMKNRCRFFLDGTLRELIFGSINALKQNGVAYLLVKLGSQHGRDLLQTLGTSLPSDLENNVSLEICASIRGTPVLRISKSLATRESGLISRTPDEPKT